MTEETLPGSIARPSISCSACSCQTRLPSARVTAKAVPQLRIDPAERGLTQEQVATRMGISIARVSQIESGDEQLKIA